MKYEIHSKSDFMTGSFLIVRIPEEKLDKTALKTIQADCPDFILPFHHRSIDGQVELVYQIGSHSKLRYISGDRTVKEYIELWASLLQPLTECGDWFMDPYSFVLNADHLYYDKSKNAVAYIYIPSICGCSDNDALKEMTTEVSKMITVSDAVLENMVLRAIVTDSNPIEFLQMIKSYSARKTADLESSVSRVIYPVYKPQTVLQEEAGMAVEESYPKSNHTAGYIKNNTGEESANTHEDIYIDIKPNKAFLSNFKGKKESTGRKKESGGFKVFGGKSVRKKEQQQEEQECVLPVLAQNNKPAHPSPAVLSQVTDVYDITQSTPDEMIGTGFRYIGHAHLPHAIEVILTEGEVFTIGRHDASIGRPQSSFEFDKKTKAVSRRHAVIERDLTGYKIIDLSSSAGTFVDNRKIPPNTPYGLEAGCRVSFGNSGADYVWEAS